MAIVLCTHCKFIREVGNQHEGKRVKCPACQTLLYVQNSVALITDLSGEISQLHEEILQLKQNIRLTSDEATRIKKEILKEILQLKQDAHLTGDKATKIKSNEATKSKSDKATKIKSGYAFANLTSSPIFENYDDIIRWFKAKQITVEPDKAAMDISGFFDEIAVKLGDNYAVLSEFCEKIKRVRGGQTQFTLDIAARNPKDIDIIIKSLKELYDNAFITRYVHNKYDKKIYISLQTVPKIVNFFNGDWLEWYALMKVATLLVDKKVKFSCLRGFQVHFPNQERNEIDLFFLINGKTPLWIECKSGEFRQFIGKYSTLRKRLQLEKANSLLLVLGMPDEKVVGLTNTFELTVVNENNFLQHIAQKI
jgi:regulator of replication initiation timing